MPAGFIRTRLLPAVRANTGLRRLGIFMYDDDYDDVDEKSALEEAKRILAAR